jgi:putative ABC transport system permease protein
LEEVSDMNVFLQDVRYGFRTLLRNPGFTTIAVLTLAIGIGANTAIFSVVNAVLLRSLPYSQSDRLISLDGGQSRPDLEDFQRQSRTISRLGGFAKWRFDLLGRGEPEQVNATLVSLNLFQVLGVDAEVGRTLSDHDDLLGGEPVVVISHNFWQQRFGADPSVVGRTLNLTGKNYTVVGVMPPNFRLPQHESELWIPFRVGYPEAANFRGVHMQYAIGRLAPRASIAQAQAEVNAIGKGLSKAYPDENRDRHWVVVSLQERVVRNVRRTILVLFGAVGFVLLIASANFANLLLAKASARRAEVQIRLALGAGSRRLVRQLLTESLLLASLSGVAGIALGYAALQALLASRPTQLPSLASVKLDLRVLGFAVLISLLTGVIFGLFPAFEAVASAKVASIQQRVAAARQAGSSALFRQALIVGEIALCVALLCGSGLLIRSLLSLQDVSPGFNPSALLTAQLWLPETRYHEIAKQDRLLTDVLDNLRSIPGVQSVSLATELPFGGQYISHDFVIADRPPLPIGSEPDAGTNLVSPDYFTTLQIPILAGRAFTTDDRTGSPLAIIVNKSMANQYWPGQDPVGSRIHWAREEGPPHWMTVVGVSGDVKSQGLDQPEGLAVYTPIFQKSEEWRRWATVVVRSAGLPPMQLSKALQQQVWALDAQLPVVQIVPMEALLDESLAERRFNTFLLGALAAISLTLAMIGVYGVISYTVTQRTREFGIRMALGAIGPDLLRIVLAGAVRMVAIGAAIGLALALALTKLLSGLLFGVSSRDPLTFMVTALLLLMVALLATFVPARRATKVDPMVALRYE